jgi:hypothetical protein
MIFIMHSMTLLCHLPFLVKCEPRGPQQKLPRKTFEEIRDGVLDIVFQHIYRMKKASFEQLYAMLLPWLDVEFLPGGGGAHGHHSTYIIMLGLK